VESPRIGQVDLMPEDKTGLMLLRVPSGTHHIELHTLTNSALLRMAWQRLRHRDEK
jgi:hypothetical protein